MKTNSHLTYKRLFSTLASQPSFIKDGLKVCETMARLERTGKNFKVAIFTKPNQIELVNFTRLSIARKQLIKNYYDIFQYVTTIEKRVYTTHADYLYSKQPLIQKSKEARNHAEAKTTTK